MQRRKPLRSACGRFCEFYEGFERGSTIARRVCAHILAISDAHFRGGCLSSHNAKTGALAAGSLDGMSSDAQRAALLTFGKGMPPWIGLESRRASLGGTAVPLISAATSSYDCILLGSSSARPMKYEQLADNRAGSWRNLSDVFRLDLFGIALSKGWRRKTLIVAVNSAREGMPWEGAEIDCIITRMKEAAATFYGAGNVCLQDDWKEAPCKGKDARAEPKIKIRCLAVARAVATFPRALVAFSISAVGEEQGAAEAGRHESVAKCTAEAKASCNSLTLSRRWLLSRAKVPTNASDKYKRVANYAAQVLLAHDALAIHEPGFHFVLPQLLSSAQPLLLACLDGGDHLQYCELRRRFGAEGLDPLQQAATLKAREALGLAEGADDGGLVVARCTDAGFERASFSALALFSEGGFADWLRRWRGLLSHSLAQLEDQLALLVLTDFSGTSKLLDEIASIAALAFEGRGGGVLSIERAVSFVSAGRRLGFCSLLFSKASRMGTKAAAAAATAAAAAASVESVGARPLPALVATQDIGESWAGKKYHF